MRSGDSARLIQVERSEPQMQQSAGKLTEKRQPVVPGRTQSPKVDCGEVYWSWAAPRGYHDGQ